MVATSQDGARALSPRFPRFVEQRRGRVEVEITRYVALSGSVSLLDELVEN
jgi:hypothetical protein